MMVRKETDDLRQEITPEYLFRHRREFMKVAALFGAGSLLAACLPEESATSTPTEVVVETAGSDMGDVVRTDVINSDVLSSYEDITRYMNFYEFSVNKGLVPELAHDFTTSDWNIEVSGLVREPRSFSIEDILKEFSQEERIYRLRCVEGWSMVIPWQGFPLWKLLEQVQPLPEGRFVRFETLLDPEAMPGQKSNLFPWPYQEGLRLDEAMHDLTILATGLYGNPMPNENGAPIRLVVPWKYGFKSIKSIRKIEVVDNQPKSFWSDIAPNEYGFFANVNPLVDHPRWSQATERRIGEPKPRPTTMFNGYPEVAYLYEGMDLKENF